MENKDNCSNEQLIERIRAHVAESLDTSKYKEALAHDRLSHLGGDYNGTVAVAYYQTEISAFHIYAYLAAKEQLTHGVKEKEWRKSLVRICTDFNRMFKRFQWMRKLYKSFIKELKTKSTDEVRTQYKGVKNYFVDTRISDYMKMNAVSVYVFNSALDQQWTAVDLNRVPIELGTQCGAVNDWEQFQNGQ